MELKQYLNRIEIAEIKNPSLEFLTELQNRRLLTIPFEDLDIPNRARIVLDLERIYNKIILTKRGGFCYELNGLFHWLLTQLGFRVEMLSARVYNHSRQEPGPEFDHMTILVHLDHDYLTDVGFGDSFRQPIKMPDGEIRDVSGHYRIAKISEDNFELQREEGNDWKIQHQFTLIPRGLSDYNAMCDFQQDAPNSSFRIRNACTITTPNGRITLSDSSLTVTENGKKTRTELSSELEFYSLLGKHFGIELERE